MSRVIRLSLLCALLIALIAGCIAPTAQAPAGGGEAAAVQFPSKAIQIMAPANPGGGWDTTARLVAQKLTEGKISSVPVEVFNVPGAGGTVGLAQLASQNQGDAHTIMMMGRVMIGAILTNNSPVTLKETTPLARLTAEYEAIVVNAASPYQTLQDLVDAFKADPKSIAWAGGSAGGTDHILVGQIAKVVGVAPADINYIAYAGGGEASTAILANEVAAGVSSVSEFSEFVRAGQMRMLAVSSEKRLDVVADVPTLKESGVDVALLNWRGLVAPAGISDAERAALIDLLTKMNESQAWKDELAAQGWDNVFLTDGFDAYLEEENATITAVLKEIGLVK